MMVFQLTLTIARKGWMRLIAHAGFDVDFIDAVSDFFGRRSVRQRLVLRIQISHHRHRTGRLRHQLVRTLQIMILQRRRVDIRDEFILVFAVSLRRIEMFRAFGERGIEDSLPGIRG